MTHEEAMQDDFQVPNNVKLDSSHPEQNYESAIEEANAELQSQLAAKEKEIEGLKEIVHQQNHQMIEASKNTGQAVIKMTQANIERDHYKALAEKQNEYITSLFKRVALHSPYYENGRKLQLEFEALKTQSPDK